jgi:hypothetical protein
MNEKHQKGGRIGYDLLLYAVYRFVACRANLMLQQWVNPGNAFALAPALVEPECGLSLLLYCGPQLPDL